LSEPVNTVVAEEVGTAGGSVEVVIEGAEVEVGSSSVNSDCPHPVLNKMSVIHPVRVRIDANKQRRRLIARLRVGDPVATALA